MKKELLIKEIKKVKRASDEIALLTTKERNDLLKAIHDKLIEAKDSIFKSNEKDVESAKTNTKLNEALVDRLILNDKRFKEMTDGILKVISLDDPIDISYDGKTLKSKLHIEKRRVPLGVILAIYESRPNVTIDIATLCLKSGNAVILKGGSEAFNTNLCLYNLIQEVLESKNYNKDMVYFLQSKDREDINNLLRMSDLIDVVIPRGGVHLQKLCQDNSSIPVIIGGFGISHIFIDKICDLDKAIDIVLNAKTSKPSACNSLDTILLHEDLKGDFLQRLVHTLHEHNIKIYAPRDVLENIIVLPSDVHETKEDSFDIEYLSLALNIKFVSSVDSAIEHMRAHGAVHSDSIITNDLKNANRFIQMAPSACVYVNASTRFTDGGQFGMGAEVAISTQKLHVRGPMGLNDLTTYKYVAIGDYLVRE